MTKSVRQLDSAPSITHDSLVITSETGTDTAYKATVGELLECSGDVSASSIKLNVDEVYISSVGSIVNSGDPDYYTLSSSADFDAINVGDEISYSGTVSQVLFKDDSTSNVKLVNFISVPSPVFFYYKHIAITVSKKVGDDYEFMNFGVSPNGGVYANEIKNIESKSEYSTQISTSGAIHFEGQPFQMVRANNYIASLTAGQEYVVISESFKSIIK